MDLWVDRLQAWGVVCCCMWLGSLSSTGYAQTTHDEIIDAIRRMDSIGSGDQRRIGDWVMEQLRQLGEIISTDPWAGFKRFRDQLHSQYVNPDNTEEFRLQLAAQTTSIAVSRFQGKDLHAMVARSLARVLVDLDHTATIPGLLVGLKFPDPLTRYLATRGLCNRRSAVEADDETFERVFPAIREAALAEPDPVVLGRLYEALWLQENTDAAFETYLAVFDKRLAYRRGPATVADGAEIPAYEFLRAPEVLATLSEDHKVRLVERLAVFLRMDAERYNHPAVTPPQERRTEPDPGYYERVGIERMLDAVEDILTLVVDQDDVGQIRREFANRKTGPEAVLREAYRWVGDPASSKPGILNGEPWNVPPGAP